MSVESQRARNMVKLRGFLEHSFKKCVIQFIYVRQGLRIKSLVALREFPNSFSIIKLTEVAYI